MGLPQELLSSLDSPMNQKSYFFQSLFGSHVSIMLGFLFLILIFLLTGCDESGAYVSEPTAKVIQEEFPHVSPYIDVIVSDIEIHYTESNPTQVEIIIRGSLPDQCEYDFFSLENRRGQNIKITLKGIHPQKDCTQDVQIIEYSLLLGRDLSEDKRGFAPGNYALIVNNFQTHFTITE